ncbi:hypothetical protein [Paludibacterium denitrificans]|uniref:hypothetical protein n=1 Tax=Paludibacterium denitrificans TaxID=2675226 RepID=UPI002477E9F8
MVRGLTEAMRLHHKVDILDEAISAAVHLSSRYITGRQLPDKAISVLDTACARVALSRSLQAWPGGRHSGADRQHRARNRGAVA